VSHDAAQDGDAPLFRRWALVALALTMPFAVFVAYGLFVLGAINWCGISGCSGGGFGVHRGDPGVSIAYGVIAAAVLSIPLYAYPWSGLKRVRFGAATGLFFVAALVAVNSLLAQG
jgi:hypothetical protein